MCYSYNQQPLCGDLCYNPADHFSGGGQFYYFYSITNADYNNDGKTDFAITGNNSAYLSIFLGDGTGGFSNNPSSYVGNSNGLTSADFNGDGIIDLASLDYNVSVFLGTGTGSFNTAINTSVGGTYSGGYGAPMISADFNGDTKTDLAILTDSIVILLGNGAGSFNVMPKIFAGLYPFSLASADFNEDGFMDLASVVAWQNNILLFLGTGTGSFNPPVSISAGSSISSNISSEDYNGDTHADLATYTDSLVVLLGNGSGTYASLNKFASVGPTLVGDYNGDGKIDFASMDYSSNIYFGLGTGTGSFGGVTCAFPVNTYTSVATTADFNGDGNFDFIVAGGGTDYKTTLVILLSCDPTTDIKRKMENGISIYPNPTSGILNIETQNKNPEIKITNLLGDEINPSAFDISPAGEKHSFDVSYLQNGIYFVSVKTSEGLFTKKIVVQH